MMLLVIMIGITSSGCSLFKEYVFVSRRMPIIKVPDSPKLELIKQEELLVLEEITRNKLHARDKNLKIYAKKLKISIDVYNEFAKKHNKISGFYSSLEQEITEKTKDLHK